MDITCNNLREFVQTFSLVHQCDLTKNGMLRIATPFYYPNGSQIDLFLQKSQSMFSAYTLSDYGQTAAYLFDMQIKPWATSKRRTLIRDICAVLDVSQEAGQFEVGIQHSQLNEIPSAIVRLAQACIRVADISFTQRLQTGGAFQESVEEFIADMSLPYEADVQLAGKYGNIVKVDFSVKGKQVRSLVQTLSAPTTTNSHSKSVEVFRRWYDLQPHKDHHQFVTVFDSARPVYRDEDLDRLQSVSAVFGFPEEHQEIEETLAA